jgi:RNA polymerase sigma-70 factor, ECF subfamily
VDISNHLRRIHEGDPAAFAPIVTHFQGPLFGYLGRMGLGQAAAQDIAQETFLRAWTQLATYDAHRAQFSTWLFTIARNLALNTLAKAQHQHEWATEHPLPEVPCDAPQPPDALHAAQRRAQLQQALRALPLGDRSVLALAYFHELDMSAIARIEGCSVAAAKVRLHRAKTRLRELFYWENAHA